MKCPICEDNELAAVREKNAQREGGRRGQDDQGGAVMEVTLQLV